MHRFKRCHKQSRDLIRKSRMRRNQGRSHETIKLSTVKSQEEEKSLSLGFAVIRIVHFIECLISLRIFFSPRTWIMIMPNVNFSLSSPSLGNPWMLIMLAGCCEQEVKPSSSTAPIKEKGTLTLQLLFSALKRDLPFVLFCCPYTSLGFPSLSFSFSVFTWFHGARLNCLTFSPEAKNLFRYTPLKNLWLFSISLIIIMWIIISIKKRDEGTKQWK